MKHLLLSFIGRNAYICRRENGNELNLKDILMRKVYLRPETKAVDLVFDRSFLQSGGGPDGMGQGSDMDDPDESQNPF